MTLRSKTFLLPGLLSGLGAASVANPANGWTDDGDRVFLNAVRWAASPGLSSLAGRVTDADGRTGLPGLLAAGEVACTGVHGANRLASNSLLEAVVYSHRAARTVAEEPVEDPPWADPPALPGVGGEADAKGLAEIRKELRALMWDDCGIVRSDERLDEADARVRALHERADALWLAGPIGEEAAETRNLCQVAALIVASARSRKESRGLHYNTDHPRTDERFRTDTVLCPVPISD